MSGVLAHYERYVIFYALFGLGLGIGVGVIFPLATPLAHALDFIVHAYNGVAPFVLYFILAPSLLKMVQQKGSSGGAWFSIYTAFWFAKMRLFACLFAIVAVSAVYDLPLFDKPGDHDAGQALTALRTFGWMATESRYFYAIYASIFTVVVLRRREGWLVQRFIGMPEVVESLGKLLTHVVPLFTFVMGIYAATLPVVLSDTLQEYRGVAFGAVSLFGLRLEATTPGGILGTYLAVALLTGALCTMWHLSLLLYVKLRLHDFSIASYFRDYFGKLYPLLWATCSEALGTPLSMHLVKKNYPRVNDSVRHLVISATCIFNVNGTLTCCFVMIPAVSMMLGLDISVLSLLLCFPVIYIIGFGIPGIPGELVLFAGPIMGMLGVPADLQPAFLLVFISLQIGLPDSFRTGANSTDGCPAVLLLNETYSVRLRGRRCSRNGSATQIMLAARFRDAVDEQRNRN